LSDRVKIAIKLAFLRLARTSSGILGLGDNEPGLESQPIDLK